MSQQIHIRPSNDGCGRAYPVIVCDHCGKPITDAKDGNTVWRESRFSRNEEQFIPIYHTHKLCNWTFMHRRFPEPADGGWLWMSHDLPHDLPHDLFMLLLNVEYDAVAAKHTARLMA
jgi:hypothetical protein